MKVKHSSGGFDAGKSSTRRQRTRSVTDDSTPGPKAAAAPLARRPSRSPAPRRAWWQSGGILAGVAGLVVVVVVAFVLIAHARGGAGGEGSGQPAPAAVVDAVTRVSPAVSGAVGTGGLPNPLKAVPPTTPLTGPSGKPQVLYIGAGYCPYCAAERWSLIVALSRFGSFSGLQLERSSSTDVFPNTPTFSFYGSGYHSDYLDFVAVEETGHERTQRLQSPTAAQQQLLRTYDADGSIPFVDLANRYTAVGSGYSPQLLGGHSWQDIASALSDPNAATTRGIVGNANYLTAALCQVTGNQPASACTAAPIPSAQQQLGAGS